jgi:hypothetical protein
MSFAMDVNILHYASDQGSESHAPAARFLKDCAWGARLSASAGPLS